MSTFARDGQMKLGEIIDALKALPSDAHLQFDFGGLTPIGLCSYRGDYSDLAVQYSDGASGCTVGKALEIFESGVMKHFTGWKGGEFLMTRNTIVWVAQNGDTSGTVITKIERDNDRDWLVIIHTEYRDF